MWASFPDLSMALDDKERPPSHGERYRHDESTSQAVDLRTSWYRPLHWWVQAFLHRTPSSLLNSPPRD